MTENDEIEISAKLRMSSRSQLPRKEWINLA